MSFISLPPPPHKYKAIMTRSREQRNSPWCTWWKHTIAGRVEILHMVTKAYVRHPNVPTHIHSILFYVGEAYSSPITCQNGLKLCCGCKFCPFPSRFSPMRFAHIQEVLAKWFVGHFLWSHLLLLKVRSFFSIQIVHKVAPFSISHILATYQEVSFLGSHGASSKLSKVLFQQSLLSRSSQ